MSDAHHDEITKLENLYLEHPEGRIFTHLAEAYRKGGELERAHEVLAEGIERHPDYSSAHVVLGRVLLDQDRTDDAEAEFRRVLELDPHNLIAIRSLGDLARARGDDGRALELYHRLLEQEPGEVEVQELVEEISAGGAGVTDRGWEVEPGLTELEPGPGELGESDEPGEAGVHEPDDVEVRTETIAQVYARQGLYGRAAEVYRELVRGRPEDSGLRDRLAEMEQLAAAQADQAGEVDAVSDFRREEPESIPASTSPDWSDEQPDEVAGVSEGSEASEVDAFGLEGFESTELDTSTADDDPIPGLVSDEEGVHLGAPDLSEELGVTDVPEPPEEAPWGGELAVEMEESEPEAASAPPMETEPSTPDWLAEALAEEAAEEAAREGRADPADAEPAGAEPAGAEALSNPDTASAESVWSGAEWEAEPEADDTPHAWIEEDEDDADTSPPIRDYFSGLLSWPVRGGDAADGAAGEPSGEEAAAGKVEREGGRGGEDEDDDLDMFRSWLESLKQ